MDSDEDAEKVDKFFSEELPFASLTIKRSKARIYSIPSDAIKLSELFMKMEKGRMMEDIHIIHVHHLL